MRNILIAIIAFITLITATASATAGGRIYIGDGSNYNAYGNGHSQIEEELAYWQNRYDQDANDQEACLQINQIKSQYGYGGQHCVFGQNGQNVGNGYYQPGYNDNGDVAGAIVGGIAGAILGNAISNAFESNRPPARRGRVYLDAPQPTNGRKLENCKHAYAGSRYGNCNGVPVEFLKNGEKRIIEE